MIAYEWCMKIGVVLNPLALNKQPQNRQRILGHEREDHTMNIKKIPKWVWWVRQNEGP